MKRRDSALSLLEVLCDHPMRTESHFDPLHLDMATRTQERICGAVNQPPLAPRQQ